MARINSVFWRRKVSSGFELMSLSQLRHKVLDHSLAEPQRLDFHLILLFESGNGSHMVDFKMHGCEPGTLIHVSPNQVHAFGKNADNEASLLIFRPEFLPTDFYGPESKINPPPEYVWPPATRLNESSMKFATAAIDFLKNQQTSQGVWAEPEAARHIAIGLASFAFRTAAASDPVYRQPQPLFYAFVTELENSFQTRRDAKWYAGQLDCSYRSLCRVCKAVTGETPKTMIDRRVATEARRLLAFTAISVSKIGAQLGFTEPTNFVKFFQRVVGETPDSFRRDWQNQSEIN